MDQVKKVLQGIEEYFLLICLGVMGIILFLQIILRFVFNAPLVWPEEAARYLQIWITFIGMGYGLRKGSHISMTFVKDKLPEKAQHILNIICSSAAIAAYVILIVASQKFLAHQNMLSSAMHIPMQLVYCVIPIGAVSFILYSISDVYRDMRSLFKTGKGEA